MSIYEYKAQLGMGEERSLSDYRGKALLIVNVASKCGFTPQYKGLQSLYEKFGPRGFEILAFLATSSAGRSQKRTQKSPSFAIATTA